MTNFERYKQELTQEEFIQSMILNCDGCPVYPCKYYGGIVNGMEREEELERWCEEER